MTIRPRRAAGGAPPGRRSEPEGVTYGPARDEEFEAIAGLLSEQLALPRLDAAYLRWKYHANPAGAGLCVVARSGEEVVGVSGAVPCACEALGQPLSSWFHTDCLVRPAYRAQGVFSRLLGMTLEMTSARGGCFAWAFVTAMSAGVFAKVGEFARVGSPAYHVAVLPASPGDATGGLRAGARRAVARISAAGPGRRACLRAAARADIVPLGLDDPGPDTIALLASYCRGLGLCQSRSQAFLRWRFHQHPWHRYCAWRVVRSGETCGCVILRGANLVAVAAVDDPDAWAAVLGAALSQARLAGHEDLHTYTFGPPALAKALRHCGFLHWRLRWRPAGLYPDQVLMARWLPGQRPETLDIADLSCWAMQMADLDCGL